MKLNYKKGQVPTKYEIRVGEIAYNVEDRVQYTKLKDDSIVKIGGINTPTFPTDEGKTWTARATGNQWEEIVKIESGSNADGSWTKFPDGTLIQYGTIDAKNYIGDGSGYYLPIPFIDATYSITSECAVASSPGEVITVTESRPDDASAYILKMVGTNGIGVGAGYKFSFQAIGRWK